MNALQECILHLMEGSDEYWKVRAAEADLEINNLLFRADQRADMQERDLWSRMYAEMSGTKYGGAYSLDDLRKAFERWKTELDLLRKVVRER